MSQVWPVKLLVRFDNELPCYLNSVPSAAPIENHGHCNYHWKHAYPGLIYGIMKFSPHCRTNSRPSKFTRVGLMMQRLFADSGAGMDFRIQKETRIRAFSGPKGEIVVESRRRTPLRFECPPLPFCPTPLTGRWPVARRVRHGFYH